MKKLSCLILTGVFYISTLSCSMASNCCCPSDPDCCKPFQKTKKASIKDIVKEEYSKVAEGSKSCIPGAGCCGGGGDLSQYLGYSDEELNAIPEANLGLGCGHPVSLGAIKKGDTILDLGSGAGIDCFLAAKKTGPTGKVIGVDMTESMIQKARGNAQKYGFKNVEFRLGDIENLPVEDNSVEIIISNCVINLTEDKLKVFQEAYRVLQPGGKMYVSDVVLLSELSPEQRNSVELIAACVGGALLKTDYLDKLEKAGFKIEIVGEDTEINVKWFGDKKLDIASLKFIAHKK